MSSRSEVYISTTNEGYRRMRELGESLQLEHNVEKLLCMSHEPEIVDTDERGTVFGWTWVKWYDSYEDVQHVENILEIASEEGIPWEFLRLGEEYDDVEKRYSESPDCPRYLSVSASWN